MKLRLVYIAPLVILSSCAVLSGGSKGQTAKTAEYYTTIERESLDILQPEETEVTIPVEETVTKSANDTVITPKYVNYSLLLNGEWVVMEVNGEKVEGDDRPYFTFEATTGRYYGNNGCNTLNGTYLAESEGRLTLGEGATTLRMCNDAPYEHIINVALGQTVGYRITKSGRESILHLLSSKGRTVMLLKRANMDYVNGAWKVTAINGKTDLVTDKMQFVFDIQEMRVHGNAGCNIVNGSMFMDPDKANSLQFHGLISTRMMCPDINGETAILVALEETSSCYKIDGNTIVFKNASGEEVLRLDSIELNR